MLIVVTIYTRTQPFYSSPDFVRDNPGELVPEETFTHSHLSWSSIIAYLLLYLLWSMASSLFSLRAWQSFSTISLQVFFGLPLGLAPSTSYSIHFFTQLSSFCSTCPYRHNLICCSSEIMSSNPSLSLNSLLGTLSCNLTPHIHLAILISACWSAISFSFQVSLHTQLLYNLPLTINDLSLLVSNGTNGLNLFQLIRILVSTAASASPSTLNMSPR